MKPNFNHFLQFWTVGIPLRKRDPEFFNSQSQKKPFLLDPFFTLKHMTFVVVKDDFENVETLIIFLAQLPG